jgi:hypothetical protein
MLISFRDPSASGDTQHDPPSGVTVEALTIWREKGGALRPVPGCQVDRPGGRRASGIMTILPPLRRMVRVRWPRSKPSDSMSAPTAETRSPLIASSNTLACSASSAEPGGH